MEGKDGREEGRTGRKEMKGRKEGHERKKGRT
jgi:hypothetical protein